MTELLNNMLVILSTVSSLVLGFHVFGVAEKKKRFFLISKVLATISILFSSMLLVYSIISYW
jgi:hypothetical protein